MDEVIFRFIGKIILIGGGAAGVAYAVFAFLGKKWIEQKFSERLVTLKNEQARELAKLKAEINTTFSRVTKIHQKEFEVLPVMWEKLQYAIGSVHNLVKPFKQYADISRMSPPAFDQFLKDLDLPQYKKDELSMCADKQNYYIEAVYEIDLSKAHENIRDFHNFILFNKIFLEEDLFQKFSEIDRLLSDVSIKYQLGHKVSDYIEMSNASKEIRDNLDVKIKEVEKTVQKRLHFEFA